MLRCIQTAILTVVLLEVAAAFVLSHVGNNVLRKQPRYSKRVNRDQNGTDYPPPCDSDIYCYGKLLHTVQMAHLVQDSKTFVDQKMLHPPDVVKQNFGTFISATLGHPTKEQTRQFVEENFGQSGTELESWIPSDWTESPRFLEGIKDPDLRQYGKELNDIWKTLGRKINPEVRDNEDMFSLIYVPNPVMVPGGRFTEFYYWDQYWILKGLLICEMHISVRGMIENFLHMISRYGYVPNGGRIYYSRSQPPMLIPMVKDYVDATGNWTFVRTHLDTLDKEFRFWMTNRTIDVLKDGRTFRFVRYNNELTGPRPESYREDFYLAETLHTKAEKDELFINLKSGAESGWDFSSRWFVSDEAFSAGNLKDIKARDIIPVDLNAFIYNNAKVMASFHRQFKFHESANYYDDIASEWLHNINSVLWNDTRGCWFDYDVQKGELKTEFYPSNIFPLWANVTIGNDKKYTASRVVEYLHSSGALRFPGGIPTSMEHSGEQWDFPNGWAPLQHLVVDALDHAGYLPAQFLAVDLAERWVRNNYRAFRNSNNTMFEKYDVQSVGAPGGGGEYEVVVGFGWSNGVIIDFLSRYGEFLTGFV
ncbi:unnamed protein product [Allacma fusca]|uniref:Alpha,alpha-trehalose glucohydrolase n=1 Tax=Allacma fusca TaxID=39272 RepID=A0A8J2LJ77_9HEXA|nr:unnamed protein product [Allacma fusca]